MNTESSPLFSPLDIGSLTLPGRLFKTATAETRATADGMATQAVIDFYTLIARGETPLIITGNIYVSRDGKSAPAQLGADHDDKIPGLAAVVAAVHAHGGKFFAQLNHCGRQVIPRFAQSPVAYSASAVKDLLTGTRPQALSIPDIQRLVGCYADAAERCARAAWQTPATNRLSGLVVWSATGSTRHLWIQMPIKAGYFHLKER